MNLSIANLLINMKQLFTVIFDAFHCNMPLALRPLNCFSKQPGKFLTFAEHILHDYSTPLAKRVFNFVMRLIQALYKIQYFFPLCFPHTFSPLNSKNLLTLPGIIQGTANIIICRLRYLHIVFGTKYHMHRFLIHTA